MSIRQRSITKTVEKEENITEYKCPNCQFWLKESEILPVTLNGDYKTNMCIYCSESIFNFKTNNTYYANIVTTINDIDDRKFIFKLAYYSLFIIGAMSLVVFSATVLPESIGLMVTDFKTLFDGIFLVFWGMITYIIFIHFIQ